MDAYDVIYRRCVKTEVNVCATVEWTCVNGMTGIRPHFAC